MWKTSPRTRVAAGAAAVAAEPEAHNLVEQSGGSGSSSASLAFALFDGGGAPAPLAAAPVRLCGVDEAEAGISVGSKVRLQGSTWLWRSGGG